MIGNYLILAFLYFLAFWCAPLAATARKSKGHQMVVVGVIHGLFALCAIWVQLIEP